MKVRFFLVFFFIFLNAGLNAQTGFEKQLQHFLSHPDYKNASVGIMVSEVETGNTVFELNAGKLLIPASVMKVVTSATALEILGADYRFQTRLGYSGKIENGTLKGDLIIIGGGDPALGSEYFKDHYFAPHFLETWAKQIRTAGIKRIQGNLVLDGSLYDSEKIPRTWIWEDMGNYYGAGPSALTVYDNQFRISFRSPAIAGLPTEIISVYPKIEGLNFKNEVLSSDDPRDMAYVFGSPFDNNRVIRGTIPKNRSAFTIKASNPFPENLLADDFLKYLANEGVFLKGQIVFEKVLANSFNLLFINESPALAEIVKVLNYESVNLFAEHLVKQVAAETTGIGNPETGLKIISEFWENRGLDIRQLFMEDGSGLSHFNAVSPVFLTSVLRYMAKTSKISASFLGSLPTAGQGTLRQFSSQNFPGKTLLAKSGSMTRVRCYSGYISSKSGKNLAFCIMVNHFSDSHQKLISELENLLVEIYNDF
ncbi:MAG: D-alanyl-D-alanine carboxypeptidase/D-alanyl-D-alanine-endopeptidase [Mariniphaga sp.]|nr:D-alanyl-D-alanine carboxypeptidase/D-alanyl-D-alanine-endopeptidase [Mariniphaga sp.]